MWLMLAFCSAFFLGCYDISKKGALTGNAVVPVLLLSILFGTVLLLPMWLLSRFCPQVIEQSIFYVPQVDWRSHLFIIVKSLIVLSSWLAGYFAIKHLPLTITGPIMATRPVMILVLAFPLFGEVLNGYQWVGVLLTVFSVFMLSASGKKEGIDFSHNKWIALCFIGAVMGAVSALYDKFLLQRIAPTTVQFWFNVYQLVVMIPITLLLWYPRRKENPFRWRWTIPLVSLFLITADFIYFYALTDSDAMITIVSMIRRGSVVVSFAGGVLFFKERNLKAKILDLVLIVVGMFFLYLGTR